MNVLGLSCLYHDAAAALVVDGQLVAAAEEERFSRKKHDFDFPQRAIDFCLQRSGLTVGDLDLVVFYEKPFLKFDRILMSCLQTFPHSLGAFREGMLVWLLDKLWVRDTITERLGIPRSKVAFCAHHLAHAASAYYCSPFDAAALLTVDGVGEWASGTRGVAWDTHLELQDKMSYPHSLGLLYSAFTAFLGFEVNEGEYKVMGLAPYGKPRFVELIFDKLLRLHDDGSFTLNLDYLAYHWSATHAYNDRFCELFGAPRSSKEANLLDPYYADVAASIQKVVEEVLVRQARVLRSRTGHRDLCMAGGVALNSVANARILREAGFDRLFVQPAAGDGGGALGAALWGYHEVLGGTKRFRMRHASWGEEHDDGAIEQVLRAQGLEWRKAEDVAGLYDEVADRLTRGQVVGWHQGRFEWGPRALGHRSILADPRTAGMKDVVNARIKFREPFRPFAPSALAERATELFDLPGIEAIDPARYMLLVVPVFEGQREHLGAITHVDGSARVQAVHAADSPVYHGLIRSFAERTGVPAVLNTSFNLRGEPIVNTPAEAYSTFFRSDMDALTLGRYLVWRRPASENRSFVGVATSTAAPAPPEAEPPLIAATSGVLAGGAAKATGEGGTTGAPQPDLDRQAPRTMHPVVAGLGSLLMVGGLTLLGLEALVRTLLPMPTLQVAGLYQQRQGEVVLTPGWKGRVHTREFDTRIEVDKRGVRETAAAAVASATQPRSAAGTSRSQVVVLGDSFVFGCWTDPAHMWTRVAERALGSGWRIDALGRPNAGTAEEAALLEREGPALHPRVVVLAFYKGNDFSDNWMGPGAYAVERGYLVTQDEDARRLAAEDAVLGTRVSPASSTLNPGVRWLRDRVRHTALYQLGAGFLYHWHLGPQDLPLNTPQAWFLKTYSPAMETAVQRTYQQLDRVREQTHRLGASLVLVSIPSSLEVDDEEWASWAQKHPQLAARMNRERPEQLLEIWSQRNKVPMLRLNQAFAGRERMYFRSDIHWTTQGHFQAGEKLADFLRQEAGPSR